MNKEFFLTEIFGLPIRGTRLTKQKRIPGNIPLVTAGEENEGVAEFISNEEQRNFKNMITIDMFGNCFFRDYLYKADDNILSFGNSKNLKAMLYIVAVIRLVTKKYSYSKQYRLKSYKLTKISLPVIEHSEPNHEYTVDDIDWQYMEDRIKELEEDRIKELEEDRIKELDAYLKVTNLDDYELTDEDKKVLSLSRKSASNENGSLETDCENGTLRFKGFLLGDLFSSSTGDVDLQQRDINGKGVFFINSGVDNHGIKGKTDRKAKIFPANTITIDFWGNAYYRDFEYKMATHNHVFSLTGQIIKNRLVGLYLIGRLVKLPTLFSYNNMATWNKLQVLTVTLPVTADSEPDFDYMERYIRAIEKLTIADVVKYKDKVIDTTKKLVDCQS